MLCVWVRWKQTRESWGGSKKSGIQQLIAELLNECRREKKSVEFEQSKNFFIPFSIVSTLRSDRWSIEPLSKTAAIFLLYEYVHSRKKRLPNDLILFWKNSSSSESSISTKLWLQASLKILSAIKLKSYEKIWKLINVFLWRMMNHHNRASF